MSVLMDRFGIGNMLGKLFGGKRDLYKVFGYTKTITYQDVYDRYRRQDITSRVIDAPANALWSNPPLIQSTDAEWNKIWNDLVISKGLWEAVNRVDKMSGMGDYSALVIGFDKTSKLSDPVLPGIADRKVLYLQPYAIDTVEIKRLVTDAANPRYLLPEMYRLTPSQRNNMTKRTGLMSAPLLIPAIDVHHTRVLHVAENYLADQVFGNPRIERVWNILDDLLKIAGGTAETFWITANRGMQVDVDKDMELQPQDEKDLSDEIDEYMNQLRRVIRTRGVKINSLGSDIPDPKNTFEMLMALMSGATGIPKRILLGSEAGQLASGEDRNNWAERVEERRNNFGEPVIIWPLIRMLTNAGVLPQNDSMTITIKWPDAFKLTPFERGQAGALRARSATNLSKAMMDSPNLLSVDEAREILELNPTDTETTGDTAGGKNLSK